MNVNFKKKGWEWKNKNIWGGGAKGELLKKKRELKLLYFEDY